MQNDPIIKLLIAERSEIIRLGLRSLIETQTSIQIIGEVDNLETLLDNVTHQAPDVILLDLSLDEEQCLVQIPKLLQARPQSKILIFSSANNEQKHLEVLRSGASGVIAKHQNAALLLKAIHSIHNGEVWFGRDITKLLWQAQNPAPEELAVNKIELHCLNAKDCNLACLASKGLSVKAISDELFISEKTVRNRLSMIYEKLNVTSKVELALKVQQLGFCKLPDQSLDRDKCSIKK